MQSGKLAVASVINLLHLCLSQLRACKSERTGRFQTSPIAESMIQTDTHVPLVLAHARRPATWDLWVWLTVITSGWPPDTPPYHAWCRWPVGSGAKVNLLPVSVLTCECTSSYMYLYLEIQHSYCACSVRNRNNYITWIFYISIYVFC